MYQSRCFYIADGLVRLGVHQLHHHADDMARGAELAVDACGGDFGQQVFIDVASGIRRLELGHLGINAVHGGDDLIQHQGRGDLEDGVAHVFGIGAFLVPVEILDKREDPFLHDGVHLPSREIMEDAPFELAALDFALSDLDLPGKNALEGETQHGGFLCPEVVRIVQVVNEHQIGCATRSEITTGTISTVLLQRGTKLYCK